MKMSRTTSIKCRLSISRKYRCPLMPYSTYVYIYVSVYIQLWCTQSISATGLLVNRSSAPLLKRHAFNLWETALRLQALSFRPAPPLPSKSCHIYLLKATETSSRQITQQITQRAHPTPRQSNSFCSLMVSPLYIAADRWMICCVWERSGTRRAYQNADGFFFVRGIIHWYCSMGFSLHFPRSARIKPYKYLVAARGSQDHDHTPSTATIWTWCDLIYFSSQRRCSHFNAYNACQPISCHTY